MRSTKNEGRISAPSSDNKYLVSDKPTDEIIYCFYAFVNKKQEQEVKPAPTDQELMLDLPCLAGRN